MIDSKKAAHIKIYIISDSVIVGRWAAKGNMGGGHHRQGMWVSISHTKQ